MSTTAAPIAPTVAGTGPGGSSAAAPISTLAVPAAAINIVPMNVKDLQTAIGMQDDLLAALLAELVLTEQTPLDVFAEVTSAEVQELVDNIKVATANLSIGSKAMVRNFFRRASAAAAPVVPPPLPNNLAAGGPIQQQLATTNRMVSHALVINQVDTRSSAVLPPSDHVVYLQRYAAIYGKDQKPRPQTEPSIEQLTCLKAILDEGAVPYVDFAIFGPFQGRLQRKLKLVGLQLHADNTFKQIEILGPPTIDDWLSSWQVFKTALVMLDVVDFGVLEDYEHNMKELHKIYGSATWLLLYQTDVRARSEHLSRIHLDQLTGHMQAQASNSASFYNPSRPWNSVYKALLRDEQFWQHEYARHALMIASRIRSPTEHVDGDAPVGGGASSGSLHAPAPTRKRPQAPTHQAPPPAHPNAQDRPGPAKKPKRRGDHRVNGVYTHNRAGRALCRGWQTGQCNLADCKFAHQCELCLANGHGSKHPQPCNAGTAHKAPKVTARAAKAAGKGGRRPQY